MIKIFVLMLFASAGALANEGFRCVPSLRETRMQVLVKDHNIEILLVNPSGYDFMPQFSGSASAYNLAFNKMQAEDLKELGDYFTFIWPKDKCKLDSSNFTISCAGEALQKVKSINSYGISTTEITEKYESDIYEKRRFRLNTEKDNLYFVNIEFYKKSCEKF